MKFVFCGIKNKHMSGIHYTLSHLGYETIIWDKSAKPTMDMVYELKPEHIIIESSDIDNSIMLMAEQYKDIKLIVLGSFLDKRLDPALFLSYYDLQNRSSFYIEPASNTLNLRNPKLNDKLKSKYISIIDRNTNISFMKRMIDINYGSYKIYGICNIPINNYRYVGKLSQNEIKDAIFNAEIGIDIDGDMWPNYAYLNKMCFTTSKTSPFPRFLNLKELNDLILKYGESDNSKIIGEATKIVKNKNNYILYVSKIFQALGYNNMKETCEKALDLL